MTTYNLIRNGIFKSLTTSGTGNVTLTWQQLEYLMDEETHGSGSVTVSGADVLYLEADISERIKVDGIHLYMTSATASGTVLSNNLNFYYKNETTDSYSLCSKALGTGYYSATIPSPSAPRYVVCVVSGIDASLYEFEIFNDDYIVAFGTDGQTFAEYLDDTPVGEIGDAQAIALYNNSTDPLNADAYTCVDWTDTNGDRYVEISSAENGTYYSILDGALLEDDLLTSEYRWSQGTHNNTTISGNNLIPTAAVGTYTTPIFKLDNKYNSSYFITYGTAVSGAGSISYDAAVYNGSIRIKSNDTEPIPVVEAWWVYAYSAGAPIVHYVNTAKYTPYTDATTKPVGTIKNLGTGRFLYACATQTASTTSERIAFSWGDVAYDYANYKSYISIVDRDGNTLYDKVYGGASGGTDISYKYFFDVNMEFDKWDGVWGYGSIMKYLLHFNYSLTTELASIYDGSDFLYDLSVDWEGDGVWYTNKNTNQIIHLNSAGTVLKTINQRQPRALCTNQDGTIWVNDTSDSKIRKFNSDGTIALEVTVDQTLNRIKTDFSNGFWGYNGSVDNVYHYNSNGVKDVDVHFGRIDRINTSHEGCTVLDENANYFYFVNFQGATYRSKSHVEGSECPAMFSMTYDKDIEWSLDVIPASYDPVWGTGAGSLEWNEVRKDGYFLPKVRFHREEITLRGDAVVEAIIIAPAVKTEDIVPETSKNMYIRTNIPIGASIIDYETKLRTWWGKAD